MCAVRAQCCISQWQWRITQPSARRSDIQTCIISHHTAVGCTNHGPLRPALGQEFIAYCHGHRTVRTSVIKARVTYIGPDSHRISTARIVLLSITSRRLPASGRSSRGKHAMPRTMHGGNRPTAPPVPRGAQWTTYECAHTRLPDPPPPPAHKSLHRMTQRADYRRRSLYSSDTNLPVSGADKAPGSLLHRPIEIELIVRDIESCLERAR